jgi:hypothetical protein
MAILTYQQYLDLWRNPAPIGFGQKIAPPSYHEYVQREIYQQDYLDLFIGNPTETFQRNDILAPGLFLVQITGNAILAPLGIPHDTLFVYHDIATGIDYMIVDYGYPWPGSLGVQRQINYIMVGEAAPQMNPKIPNWMYGNPDEFNSYFYNKLHEKGTSWLRAPVAAFGIPAGPNPKADKLLELAKSGYFLIDLFPFAINYSASTGVFNFRPLLISPAMGPVLVPPAMLPLAFSTSEFFYTNYLIPRINDLIAIGVMGNEAKMAFSGPPTIHQHISLQIVAGILFLPPGVICYTYMNDTVPPTMPAPALNWWRDWTPNDLINGDLRYPCAFTRVPYFRCLTVQNAQAGPHQLFIRNAFDLP